MPQAMTLRERRLLDRYRRCDERGQAHIDRAAADQMELSQSARQGAVDLQDIIAQLGELESCQLLGMAKGLESRGRDLQDVIARLSGANLIELRNYAKELLASAARSRPAQLQRVK